MRKTILKRVMIFIDETDRWRGSSLSGAIVERLRNEGIIGASVLKGVSGFGARGQVHTASIVDLVTNLPVIVLAVDEPEKIDRVLPLLSEMIKGGLITIDEVEGYDAGEESPAEPSASPLEHAPHAVHEYMEAPALSIGPQADMAEAVTIMLQNNRTYLPVVSDQNILLGMLSARDILARLVDVPSGENHLFWLRGAAKQQMHKDFRALHCSDVMRTHPVFVQEDTPMTKAVALMLKEHVSAIPVVTDGKLIGTLRLPEVLRKALALEFPDAI